MADGRKHTRGPWSCDGRGTTTLWVESLSEGKSIARLSTEPKPEEVRANARLIALTPALLDALENLLERFEEELGAGYEDADYARAVIAKATGEQS